MIWQAPNTTITAFLEGTHPGLVGTVSVKVLNTDASVAIAATTAGIIEIAVDTYAAEIDSTGLAEGEYLIVWAHLNPADDTETAVEELVITGNAAALSIGSGTDYITLAEVKAARDISSYTYADSDILRAISAASRSIDQSCRRRFYADADATSVRYYTTERSDAVFIDDAVSVASVTTDTANNGTYDYTWAAGDYSLWPMNAAVDSEPYRKIERRSNASRWFPLGVARIRVTAQFGWPTVPDQISQAALILASRYLTRSREATFGVLVGGGGLTEKTAIRIARTDPDVLELIRPYMKLVPIL